MNIYNQLLLQHFIKNLRKINKEKENLKYLPENHAVI